ncbi:MAG: flagellar motor protein MotB [Desulfatirhabdiaceae bacterium]
MSDSDKSENGKPVEEGAPEWVVTFGDLMSLLLCFFVLLLSFSETDKAKYKEVAGSMRDAFGVQKKIKVLDSPSGQNIIARNFDQDMNLAPRINEDVEFKIIEAEVQAKIKEIKQLVETESKGNQFIIRLAGETTFDSGKANIRPDMLPVLEQIGGILNYGKGDVMVAGHTDNVPIHSTLFRSNLELSIARAVSVAQFLIDNSNITPDRIATMGFGEHRPLVSNDTPQGRNKNRRVEIILTDLFSDSATP